MKFSLKNDGGAAVTLLEKREGDVILTDVKISYAEPTVPSPIVLEAVYKDGGIYTYYASNVGTSGGLPELVGTEAPCKACERLSPCYRNFP